MTSRSWSGTRAAAGSRASSVVEANRIPDRTLSVGIVGSLVNLMPFFSCLDDGSLEWAARLGRTSRCVSGLRGQTSVRTWIAAARIIDGKSADEVGLAGLLAEARGASPVCAWFPSSCEGSRATVPRISGSRGSRAGDRNVWAQVTALTWLVALNPQPVTLRWLHRLLESTGWRRPLLARRAWPPMRRSAWQLPETRRLDRRARGRGRTRERDRRGRDASHR